MNRDFPSQLRSDFIGCWLLATAALCVGLVANQFRDMPISLVYKEKSERLADAVANIASVKQTKSVEPPSEPTLLPPRLSLEEFRNVVNAKRALTLDARPEIFHRLGHVPGALALPRDDFEIYYQKHHSLLEGNKGQALVIYCSGGSCEDSALVESALKNLGYTNVSIFEGGWSEWTKAGQPEETNQ